MESTAFYPSHQRYTAFSYSTLSPDMYPSTLPPTPQSYLRSSAGQNYSPPSPQNFYPAYSQPPSLVDGLADDSPSSSSSSSNSGSFLSNHGNVQVSEHAQDYIPDYSNYHLAQPHTVNGYTNGDSSAIPRQMWDPAMKQEGYSPYPSPHAIEGQQNGTYPEELRLYQNYREEPQHYVAPEHMAHSHDQLSLASYYSGQDQHMASDAPLGSYTTHGELQSVVTGFSNSPRLSGQDAPQEQMHSPPPAYVSSPSASSLQYPASPVEVHSAPPQAFVNLQDVSPSPTVSPDQVCSSLPIGSPTGYGFPSNSPFATSNSSSYDYVEDGSAEVTSPALHRRPESTDRPPKKHRYASSEDEESRSAGSAADSGESEREDEADDADDDDYKPEDSKSNSRSGSRRRTSSRQAGARSFSPVELQKPRLAPPVPVPNLTKKSRGRRVPTTPVVIQQNGIEKNIRGYKCKVPGCNKCFQRGEHLKRHVRSIHTNEKPHKCPWKNCGKDFSRHDNLRQHMRVHRNEPLDPQDATASA